MNGDRKQGGPQNQMDERKVIITGSAESQWKVNTRPVILLSLPNKVLRLIVFAQFLLFLLFFFFFFFRHFKNEVVCSVSPKPLVRLTWGFIEC